MADPNPSWTLIKTVNPAEKSIAIILPQDTIIHYISALDLFVEGSLLKNFPEALIPDPALALDSTFGLYKFVDCESAGPKAMAYIFVRPKTPTERMTPFKSDSIKEPFGWLAVVPWIEFTRDTTASLSQNTQDGQARMGTIFLPQWLVRRGYIHPQTLMTTIFIREFLSDVPYDDSQLPCDEPMGTEISWDLIGSHGSTGRCLHPAKLVPGETGYYPVSSSADKPQVAMGSQNSDQFFPATNHLGWQTFTTNSVSRSNGQYHRIERTYIAPDMPPASELRS